MQMPASSARRDDGLIAEVADSLAIFMEHGPTRKLLLSQPQVSLALDGDGVTQLSDVIWLGCCP